MTCEKIWWLLRHGERWLKPEKRGAGIMVRPGGVTGTPSMVASRIALVRLGHVPRLQCSLLLCTLGGRQMLEALMRWAAAISGSRGTTCPGTIGRLQHC